MHQIKEARAHTELHYAKKNYIIHIRLHRIFFLLFNWTFTSQQLRAALKQERERERMVFFTRKAIWLMLMQLTLLLPFSTIKHYSR